MIRILYFCFVLTLYITAKSTAIAQIASDPFYPSNTELQIQLKLLANDYSEIVQYKELGHATNGNQPIMALKISDNVTDVEDEPVWVFTGFIHGNEQIGLRILIDLANELALEYGKDSNVTNWINAYEIWLIMSLNPWGYENDFSGTPSVLGTRKNGVNTVNATTSGVDLNRNFDFDWKNSGSSDPLSSGYRGASPFSEKETQAFRDLILERKPIFGISFHQGLNREGGEVFYPWGGTSGNNIMLYTFANHYANWVFNSRTLGSFCEKDSSGNYILQDPHGNPCGSDENTSNSCSELCWKPFINDASPKGYSSTWNYAAVGTVDLMVEVSSRLYNEEFMHFHEDSLTEYQRTIKAIATEFALNHREGIKSWFQHFLYSTDPVQFLGPGFTGHVTDSQTSVPLSAVIEVERTTNRAIADRTSEPIFGRFWRFLPSGEHIVKISALGYETWQDTLTILRNVPLIELEITLKPESVHVETEIAELPMGYHLSPAYPNPFHSQTQFTLRVQQSQTVEITVYNLQGRKVATLHNDILAAGKTNVFKFETRNLQSGLYMIKIRGKHFQTVMMVTAVK